MPNPNVPYLVGGKVTTSASAASSGTTVTLSQESTGETLTTTTNSNGNYVFDLANLTSYAEEQYFGIVASGSTSTSQDLRMRLNARSTGQISDIKIEYET